MENIQEDLIQECHVIKTREVKTLMTEDKIVEMIVWSIIKTEDWKPTEKNVQIKTLL
jgi:hypothetical protein